jgi:hypothetical protein
MRLDALRKRAEQFEANERAVAELALSAADQYGEARENVRASRYDADKTSEEYASARATLADAFRAVLVDADRVTAEDGADALDRHDQATAAAQRTTRRLGDVIDVTRLRESEDVAEVAGLLRTAETFGDELAAQARAVAVPTLRRLAAVEQREHKIGGPAFRALVAASAGPTAPLDRGGVALRAQHRRRELRAFVLNVATVCGLDARELVGVGAVTPMPDETHRSTIRVGPYWDKAKETK